MAKPKFSRLYPVLDTRFETKESLSGAIEALARAGCRQVQLRAKEKTAREFLAWTELAVGTARRCEIALIVNDRADIALVAEAHGVHLGQDDLSIGAARRILGNDAVIGLSTHSVAEAREATRMPVDYVAIGPVFSTATKPDAHAPLGVSGVGAVRDVVDKPLVAIGGITLERARELVALGVDALAVISALTVAARGQESLENVARQWLAIQ